MQLSGSSIINQGRECMIIQLDVTQTYKRTGKISKSISIIKDGEMRLKFYDKEQGNKTYLQMRQMGKKVKWDNGTIISKTELTAEQIADKVMKENEETIAMLNAQKQIAGEMEIKQEKKIIG